MCFVSYTELKRKEVKVRKVHRCGWCNEAIAIGEVALYRSYIFDGDFISDHMHPECATAVEKSVHDLVCEGWMPGEGKRGVPMTWENSA